ncbi:hypothetical protein TNCV_4394451 [Trichonephila clavipes]|uniref:Secreted protein n=1 Tax=Trichonephila clavipes TaxID=2585209 RepID=A0A8X7BDR8_TRICX|nr:hypothetical protein TNCV_4394451 [Trichonephila clavipes]
MHDDISRKRLLSLLVTLLLCLKEDFPCKLSTAVLQRLTFTPVVQSNASLSLRPAEKTGYYGAGNISCGRYKNGDLFFSVMSK